MQGKVGAPVTCTRNMSDTWQEQQLSISMMLEALLRESIQSSRTVDMHKNFVIFEDPADDII